MNKTNNEAKRIKKDYETFADKIWQKRFASPYPMRRYAHQRNYQTFLKHIKPGMLVADIGAGEGVLSILMAKKGARVIAVEISRPNLQAAQKLAKTEKVDQLITFIQGDAENVPLLPKTVDFTVSSHVLEHLPDFDKGLRELKRVTKKHIIVGLPTCLGLCSLPILGGGNYWNLSIKTPWHLIKAIWLTIKHIGTEGVNEKYVGMNFPHIWRYPWRIKQHFDQASLQIISIEATTICPPYLLTYFPLVKPLYRFIDLFAQITPFCYFGYGTTYKLTTKNK